MRVGENEKALYPDLTVPDVRTVETEKALYRDLAVLTAEHGRREWESILIIFALQNRRAKKKSNYIYMYI